MVNAVAELLPGRPTLYTQELAARVCARLTEGESLRSVCRDESMPGLSTIFVWIQKHTEFREQYDRATTERAEMHAEDMIEIADDGRNDWMERNDPKNPGWVANGEHIQRSRLRVETRKWAAAKLNPKKYGEISRHEHTGEGGGPILIAPARRTEIFARMIEHTGAEPKPDEGK